MIPNINYENGRWEGNIILSSWRLFFEYKYEIGLNIGGDCFVNRISIIHENGYSYLINEQENLLNLILEKILIQYPIWQETFKYEEEEKDMYMPNISDKSQLKKLISPSKIFIHNISVDNLPYIGIQFNCTWDDEHGLGILCYKNRIIKMGGSEIAFMSWIAEKDLAEN